MNMWRQDEIFFGFRFSQTIFFQKSAVLHFISMRFRLIKKMKKIAYSLLLYLMLYFHGGAVNANSIIFDEYAWINRLVIMITHEKNTDLEETKQTVF